MLCVRLALPAGLFSSHPTVNIAPAPRMFVACTLSWWISSLCSLTPLRSSALLQELPASSLLRHRLDELNQSVSDSYALSCPVAFSQGQHPQQAVSADILVAGTLYLPLFSFAPGLAIGSASKAVSRGPACFRLPHLLHFRHRSTTPIRPICHISLWPLLSGACKIAWLIYSERLRHHLLCPSCGDALGTV